MAGSESKLSSYTPRNQMAGSGKGGFGYGSDDFVLFKGGDFQVPCYFFLRSNQEMFDMLESVDVICFLQKTAQECMAGLC